MNIFTSLLSYFCLTNPSRGSQRAFCQQNVSELEQEVVLESELKKNQNLINNAQGKKCKRLFIARSYKSRKIGVDCIENVKADVVYFYCYI